MRLTPKGFELQPGDTVREETTEEEYDETGTVLLYIRHTVTIRGTLTDTNDDGGDRGPVHH